MFGQRLRELRKRRNMTLDEASKKLNIPLTTLAGYENEKRKPPIDMLIKFSDFYGVSVDYIIGLTNEPDIKTLEYDVSKYLKKKNLTWDGVPLSDAELRPIRELLEIIVRDRLPQKNK